MRDTMLLLLLAVTTQLAAALPVATLRVQFSSPPHSYSHGHDIHAAGLSDTSSVSAVLPYQAQQFHALSTPVDTQFLGYPRGRALEVAPLLQGDTQTIVEDVEPTGAELDALIARFANNAPRFFHDFPHQRALLNNIEIRMSQHLPDLRLGSIRPGSPFLRA